MKYQDAADLIKMTTGKFITRKIWESQLSYLVSLPGITNFLRVNIQPKPEVVPWAANKEDTYADDWELVDPVQEIEVLDSQQVVN